MDLTDADVTDILALLDSLPYDELDLETSSFRLTLRRTPDGWTQSTELRSAPAPLPPASPPAPPGPEAPDRDASAPDEAAGTGEGGDGGGEVSGELVAVRAPLPGTFYRAPRPGAAPFVEVGSRVSAETVIGIVETMKLMNSVPAGAAGTVAEFCVGNAEFAAQGATLLRIRADR